MDIPAFHPEWLVTFWLSTPGLNKVEPHLLLILLITFFIIISYMKRRKRVLKKSHLDEEQFQELLQKKIDIEKELAEMIHKGEQSEPRKQELEKHLALTNHKLQQYTH